MKKKIWFGVDVGGTFTKLALVSETGRIVHKSKISSSGFSHKLFFARTLKKNLMDMVCAAHLSLSDICGMGIGLPGPVDFNRGIILSLTNIKGWNNFKLVSFLKQYFSFPVFIENDANCMALAETRFGAAKGTSFGLCVTLGTGVGGGLIMDKEIYRGPFFLGGEIGHIPVDRCAPRCACGGVGCLERYVGNRAIMAQAKAIFKKVISLEEISILAKKGEPRAVKIWQEVGARIGFALAGIVNVFNPEVIVVGGGVAEAGDILLRSIKKTLDVHAMKQLKGKIKIKKAILGNDAGVLGAALLVRDQVARDQRR